MTIRNSFASADLPPGRFRNDSIASEPGAIRAGAGQGWSERVWYHAGHLLDKTLLLNVSRVGYLLRSAAWHPSETWVSMKDKVCVVTGANSGLGNVVSTRLAGLGARVYLLCRDRGRGERARVEIARDARNRHVHLQVVDVSSPDSIRDFVTRFEDREMRLDVLVNNAGVYLPERRTSARSCDRRNRAQTRCCGLP